MSIVKKFFEDNPQATECFEALGLIRAKEADANRLCAGVLNATVTRHEKPLTDQPEKKDVPIKSKKGK